MGSGLLAVLMALMGGGWIAWNEALVATSDHTTGTVEDLESRSRRDADGRTKRTLITTVGFSDSLGERHTITTTASLGLSEGASIPVAYDPARPENAIAGNLLQRSSQPLLLLLLSMLGAAGGFALPRRRY